MLTASNFEKAAAGSLPKRAGRQPRRSRTFMAGQISGGLSRPRLRRRRLLTALMREGEELMKTCFPERALPLNKDSFDYRPRQRH